MLVRSRENFEGLAQSVTAASRDYWDHLPTLALEVGISDLQEADSPRFISEPIKVPDGLVVWADCHDMPTEAVLLWPEIIRRHLAAARYEGVTITTPRRNYDVYEGQHLCPVATLTAYAPPGDFVYGEGLPRPFWETAANWLAAGGSPSDPAWLGISVKVEVPTTLGKLPGLLESAYRNPALHLFSGSLESSVRSARLLSSRLTLMHSGPALQDEGIAAHASDLEPYARLLAPHAAQIAIDIPECDYDKANPRLNVGSPGEDAVGYIADDVLEDAYPFQVLSSGHLARAPDLREMVEDLGDDRYLLRIGDYHDWQTDNPSFPQTLAQGRQLLAACMVSSDEAFRLRRLRAEK